uniref:Uncharacterized protein n=1 Tax=Arundo donax TaxID=35708 RepID=A0A0A9ANR6_ARUDO
MIMLGYIKTCEHSFGRSRVLGIHPYSF